MLRFYRTTIQTQGAQVVAIACEKMDETFAPVNALEAFVRERAMETILVIVWLTEEFQWATPMKQ